MKVNQTKAIIACLGIAAAAAIAGSVSGTVAWFQYNTRTTAEFTGTTAKCTEFLQVRTVKNGIGIAAIAKVTNADAKPAFDAESHPSGTKVITDDGKVITSTGTAWGEPANVADNAQYDVGGTIYKWSQSSSSWSTVTREYGAWGTSVNNDAILAAAGRADNGLKPVTLPGVVQSDAVAAFYGQPVCGYEQYAAGQYHWAAAPAEDYMQFQLQFRVLDIDGTSDAMNDNSLPLYAKELFLTDLTVKQIEVTGKKDISSAVRVHVHSAARNALLAYGAGSAATITTATTGQLDLGGGSGVDTLRDVPNHYTFDGTAATPLEYGSDKPAQVAYDAKYAANGLYPTNDGVGHLTGSNHFGQTNASFSAEEAHLTLTFTIFLEGWQKLGTTPSALWSGKDYIGSQFNIGMSFGVDTLNERA